MIKRPLYQTPEVRRRQLVEEFRARYPHPLFAWAERQSPFWRLILDRHLTPETKAILISGQFAGQTMRVPKMTELWDCWFRAAWWCLVPKDREARGWDDLSAEALADAFKLTRGRYQRLIAAEKKWQRQLALHPKKRSVGVAASAVPKLIDLPAFEEVFTALLTLPTK